MRLFERRNDTSLRCETHYLAVYGWPFYWSVIPGTVGPAQTTRDEACERIRAIWASAVTLGHRASLGGFVA